MYESKDSMVSHPNHYQSASGLEVIDAIEAFTEDLNGIEAVDTANVLKYICRWKHKNGKQDLEKAMWYLQHLIDHIEKENIITQTVLNNDEAVSEYCDNDVIATETAFNHLQNS